ncbi:MAG TPA: hypothetical protein PLA83_13675 [Deltaproteobacteria bacterium]|jgi:hypothetical protein|nr:hypothetical protein [Deltaproteobacteria bacterium]HQI02620.1 hypothetical protein [Deltaproteobacteria bacterium]HQJ08734.1 hypothetical protein [Deltaproteobacteria bacterium]
MAQKIHGKLKEDIMENEVAEASSPSEIVQTGIRNHREKGAGTPNIYSEVIESVFEKNRKRVAKYYCPNVSCCLTFWDAREGYVCPKCGTLGIISEFRCASITNDTRDRNIIGYIDTLGRLICSKCILSYGVQNEVALIVYDDTDPFCFESCELCREPLD